MELLLELTIPGDPVPKSRPRAAKNGHVYTPRKTQEAEEAIRALVREKMAEPYDGPVGLILRFYCATRRRTDGDNLQKLVQDALNKTAITDDSLIEEWCGAVFRRAEGQTPRTEVVLYSLDGGDEQLEEPDL